MNRQSLFFLHIEREIEKNLFSFYIKKEKFKKISFLLT